MSTDDKPKDTRSRETLMVLADEARLRETHAKDQLDAMTADRDRWRDAKPLPDKEAVALAGAIAALDHIAERRDGYIQRSDQDRFERILRFLAHRYGVRWPEPPTPEDIYASVQEDIRAGEQILVRPDGAWRVR